MERTEHPKPQFERENWLNLNGEWEFEFDFGNSGEERGQYREDAVFHQKINVPFCPESVLSGIGYTDFMTSVWYRRKINLKKELLSQRIFLHFGAVDHFAPWTISAIVLSQEENRRKRIIPSSAFIRAPRGYGRLYGWNSFRKHISKR